MVEKEEGVGEKERDRGIKRKTGEVRRRKMIEKEETREGGRGLAEKEKM